MKRTAILLTALLAVPVRAAEKPNVIVVVADDLGYADVGFQGCKDIPTPHLDALAKRGVVCTNGYVTHPFCSPTRAALLTGRYQQRFGHENNPAWLPENKDVGLPLDQPTLAGALKKLGYATGAVGKWHLGAPVVPPEPPRVRLVLRVARRRAPVLQPQHLQDRPGEGAAGVPDPARPEREAGRGKRVPDRRPRARGRRVRGRQ